MNFFVRIICCCMTILLSGCGLINHSPEQMACKTSCQQRLMACNKTCNNSCSKCCLSSTQRAVRGYQYYKYQQDIQGLPVIRQLNSYRDPLQCRKTTCECPTDYRTCIQTCAGKIPKRLQVAPVC